MPGTVLDLLTLNSQLAEAELAYHTLMTGGQAQSVSYDGKSVTFTQANAERLQAYITTLKERIAALEGRPVRRQPIYATF